MYANGDSSWNYNFLSQMWQQNGWLDSTAAQSVKTNFGAYSISNPRGLNGLKIVSINTDFWYIDNIFNYANYSNPDPNGMLRFLVGELEAAETAGQRVWIIGHVPSGYASGQSLPNPTALFQSIVVRFSPGTIAAIFWGHTHSDQKIVYYDFNTSSLDASNLRDTSMVDLTKPLAVGWIAPSVIPDGNPAWTYYQVDTETFDVMGAQVYSADISEASWAWDNMDGKWSQLYDARQAYNPSWPTTSALGPDFWHESLATVIGTNQKVAMLYSEYETRNMPSSTLVCGTSACMSSLQCSIQAGTAQAAAACSAGESATDPDPTRLPRRREVNRR